MSELLPCPFCGNPNPELVDDRLNWFVRCNECKPYATVIYGENVRWLDHMDDPEKTDEENDAATKAKAETIDWDAIKQSAVTAWNRRASLAPAVGSPMEAEPVTLTYTNWRGEAAERKIVPLSVWYGSTEWHPEPQWLLKAIDVEKDAERDFALKDFGHAAPAASTFELRPAAFEVLDHVNGTYVTRSEQAALNTEFPYNGLYRRKGALT